MRIFAAVFVIFFAGMSFLGYRQGESFISQPGAVERMAFSRIRIANQDSQFYFVYRTSEKELFQFDVDRNKLNISALESAQIGVAPEGPQLRAFILSDPSVPGVMGGVTLGLTVKDIISKPTILKDLLAKESQVRRKQIVAGILGTVSGYWVGYTYATRNALPAQDSEIVMSILRDEKKWVAQKRGVYTNILFNLQYQTSKLEDSDLRLAASIRLVTAGSLVLKKIKSGGDLSSTDLSELEKIAEMISPAYEESIGRETLAERSVVWLGWIMMAIFLFFAAWLLYDSATSWYESRKKDITFREHDG